MRNFKWLVVVLGASPLLCHGAPNLAEVTRVHEALVAEVIPKFVWSSVGIGQVSGEIGVRIDAPDQATAAALLQKYPVGTRVDGVLIGIDIVGRAVAHAGEAETPPPAPVTPGVAALAGLAKLRDRVKTLRPALAPSHLTVTMGNRDGDQLFREAGAQPPFVPCILVGAPNTALMNWFKFEFGAEIDGVPILHRVIAPDEIGLYNPAHVFTKVSGLAREVDGVTGVTLSPGADGSPEITVEVRDAEAEANVAARLPPGGLVDGLSVVITTKDNIRACDSWLANQRQRMGRWLTKMVRGRS